MNFGELLKNHLNNFILFLSVLITIVIWFNDKRGKKKSYAQIILLQIKNMEEIISKIKKEGMKDGIIGEVPFLEIQILFEKNYWEEYSHFLIKELGEKNYEKINKFYDTCLKIKNFQIEVKNKLKESLYWRGYYFYLKKYTISFNTEINNDLRKSQLILLDELEKNTVMGAYMPLEFAKQMNKLLIEYNNISDTVAYKKLKKISEMYVI